VRGGPGGRPRPAVVLVVALAGALLLSGCWDRVELNDLEVISGAAFDAAPGGGMQVTVSLILPQNLPSGGGGEAAGTGAPTAAVLSAAGPTIGDAVTRLAEMVSGRLFWGQTRVVLIGQDLARRGVDPVLDFFLRARTPRLRTDVLVVPGNAGVLLQVGPPLRVPATDTIFEHLRQGIDPRAYMFEIAESRLTAGDAMLVPTVRAARPAPGGAGSGGAGGAAGGAAGGGGPSEGQTVTPELFRFGGAAILHAGQLAGWLDPAQTQGAQWLLGRMHQAVVRVQAPDGSEVGVRISAVRVLRRAVAAPGGQAAIEVQIDANAAVEQVDRGAPPLNDPRYLLALSDQLDRRIVSDADQALQVMQRSGIDFLHFGRLVAAYRPSLWRHLYPTWPAALAELPVQLRVRAHVRSTGNLLWLP
jgi:spore germination protein KC